MFKQQSLKMYQRKIQAMKKVLILFVILIINACAYAQAPLQLNFQGAARNAQGSVLANKSIRVRLSILNSITPRTIVYSETRTVTTTAIGLFNLVIGSTGAENVLHSMSSVDWSAGSKFVLLEMDPDGGNNFMDLGTTQLQSVPFALNANSAAPIGNAGGDLAGSLS